MTIEDTVPAMLRALAKATTKDRRALLNSLAENPDRVAIWKARESSILRRHEREALALAAMALKMKASRATPLRKLRPMCPKHPTTFIAASGSCPTCAKEARYAKARRRAAAAMA